MNNSKSKEEIARYQDGNVISILEHIKHTGTTGTFLSAGSPVR